MNRIGQERTVQYSGTEKKNNTGQRKTKCELGRLRWNWVSRIKQREIRKSKTNR